MKITIDKAFINDRDFWDDLCDKLNIPRDTTMVSVEVSDVEVLETVSEIKLDSRLDYEFERGGER